MLSTAFLPVPLWGCHVTSCFKSLLPGSSTVMNYILNHKLKYTPSFCLFGFALTSLLLEYFIIATIATRKETKTYHTILVTIGAFLFCFWFFFFEAERSCVAMGSRELATQIKLASNSWTASSLCFPVILEWAHLSKRLLYSRLLWQLPPDLIWIASPDRNKRPWGMAGLAVQVCVTSAENKESTQSHTLRKHLTTKGQLSDPVMLNNISIYFWVNDLHFSISIKFHLSSDFLPILAIAGSALEPVCSTLEAWHRLALMQPSFLP